MAEVITPFKPTVVDALETVIAYEALAISGKYNVSEAVIEFVEQLENYQPTQITAKVDGTITLNFATPVPERILDRVKFLGEIKSALSSKFKISAASILVGDEPTYLPTTFVGSALNLYMQGLAYNAEKQARLLAVSPATGSSYYKYDLPPLATLDRFYYAFGIESRGQLKSLRSISFSSQI